MASCHTPAVVEKFYASINKQDLTAIAECLADDVLYDDLAVFTEPMKGPQEVIDFFTNVFKAAGPDLRFVVDGITPANDKCVGVLWHLENQGSLVPYGKGCSFYGLAERNGTLKIITGRDLRESTVKSNPGENLDANNN